MNGNSIYADEYKVQGGAVVTLKNLASEPIFKDKVYDVNYVNQKSSNYKDSRRFMKINWEKSFKELHKSSDEWKKEIQKVKEKELYSLKRSINFPTNESYTQAVEMGEESSSLDYLIHLESDIEAIKGLKPEATAPKKRGRKAKEDVTVEEIKDEAND